MDKIELSVIGIGVLAVAQLIGNATHTKVDDKDLMREESQAEEFIIPGIALNEFVSERYKIAFKYPKEWKKNPRYEDKYEGKSGFFEVGDFTGSGEDIDEVINEQINEYYKPYGENPTIRKFVIDGQPARVIYPSDDQSEFFNDREATIVVQYPEPISLEGRKFDYVDIWVSKTYVPLILSTLKFVKQP